MPYAEKFASTSVLIIDDSDLTRELLKTVLNSFGIKTVHEAGDGLAGFEVMSRQAVDLIICDVFMSPMHGLKFVEMLRSGQRPPEVTGLIATDTPIIMITAKKMKNLAEDAKAGWDAMLDKPIKPDVLLTELLRLVKGARHGGEQ
ncbi:MAG: response regulator [Rhodospirillaceae bacterium]